MNYFFVYDTKYSIVQLLCPCSLRSVSSPLLLKLYNARRKIPDRPRNWGILSLPSILRLAPLVGGPFNCYKARKKARNVNPPLSIDLSTSTCPMNRDLKVGNEPVYSRQVLSMPKMGWKCKARILVFLVRTSGTLERKQMWSGGKILKWMKRSGGEWKLLENRMEMYRKKTKRKGYPQVGGSKGVLWRRKTNVAFRQGRRNQWMSAGSSEKI